MRGNLPQASRFALALLLACAAAAYAGESASPGPTNLAARFALKPPVQDYYPVVSRMLDEQGTTTVRLCYDDQGVPGQVTVAESSGFARLDAAALRWGQAVRIRPGVFRGQPRPACVRIFAVFSLKGNQEPPSPLENFMILEPDPDLPLPPPHPAGRFIPLEAGAGRG